jgi:hypothetical protein
MYIIKLLKTKLGIRNYKVENVWVFGWKNIIIYVLENLTKKNTSIRKLLDNEKK